MSKDRLKVEDDKSLVRDVQSNAILSLDTDALKQSRRSRSARDAMQKRMVEMEKRMELLEDALQFYIKNSESDTK